MLHTRRSLCSENMRTQKHPSNNLRINWIKISGWWLLIAMLLSGCSGLLGPDLPTPVPTGYLPTLIALTLEAQPETTRQSTATRVPATPALETPTPEKPSPTSTAQPTRTLTPTTAGPTATPYPQSPSPEPTVIGEIPNAEIEIRNLGPLSRVTSPLHIYGYLRPGAGGKVRIELLGEDHRLLARQIKTFTTLPAGAWAVLLTDLEFEIAGVAEAGRLQISVDDEYGRTTALNSVPLILLSLGDNDITPPIDVLAPISIQQPQRKTLVQGGTLLVSGIARPGSDQPLMVKLLSTEGQELGMRLAKVNDPIQNGYGSFVVEVAYSVEKTTPALLVVTEGGRNLNDVIHLTSKEIVLSP